VFTLDCGIAINPDLIRAQVEGGILFGLSAAAWGEIFLGAGGDILTPVGHRVQEVEGVILGTALAGVDSVWAIVVEPSATLLDVILETVAGTTVTIKDPSGKAIATATVGDGGVVDLQALSDGAGTYALVLHQDSAGDAAFTAWEAITEKN